MKQLMMLLLALALVGTSQAFALDLKGQLKAAQGKEGAEHEKIVIEASKAIKSMPRKMDGTWDEKQVSEVVELMRAEKDQVYRLQMLEENAVHLKDNRKALEGAIKKLPKPESRALLRDLNSTIRLLDSGQDPDPRRQVPQ